MRSEQAEARVHLTMFQRVRLQRALGNIDPGAKDVFLYVEPRGITLLSPGTGQKWTIGPRGGSF